jgi:hypothetical protein
VRLAIRQGVGPAVIGTGVGLAAAAGISRVNTTLFASAGGLDAGALGAAALALVAIAIGASYVPARRIANDDASLALRCE